MRRGGTVLAPHLHEANQRSAALLIEARGGGADKRCQSDPAIPVAPNLFAPFCTSSAPADPNASFRSRWSRLSAGDGDQPNCRRRTCQIHLTPKAEPGKHLRLERRRRLLAHSGRNVRQARRRADDPRSVPRQRPLLGGAARWPDRHDRGWACAAARQHRRRPGAGAGRHHQGAHSVPARRAGGGRSAARLPVPDVGRAVRAGQDAEADRRPAGGRGRQGDAGPRHPEALRRRQGRPRRLLARGLRQVLSRELKFNEDIIKGANIQQERMLVTARAS